MFLSRYNKFIFSVFSETNDCLILTIYLNRTGKTFDAFLHALCSKINSAGNHLTSFVFKTELEVIDITSRVITFSKGKMIFMDDSIKADFNSDMVMFYLNYTWCHGTEKPFKFLIKETNEITDPAWDSYNFKCVVKGNFISPNISSEFKVATGSLDLLRSEVIPEKVHGLLWTRLHNKDLDLAYSLVFNGSTRLHSKLSILYGNKQEEFTDVEYKINKEIKSPRSGLKYPGNVNLIARNDNCQISVNLRDQKEIVASILSAESNFFGKLAKTISGMSSRIPRALKLQAIVDVTIHDNSSHNEFKGINSISEYINVAKVPGN
jgi:hypothetical protein